MLHTLIDWIHLLGRSTVEMLLEHHRLLPVAHSHFYRFVGRSGRAAYGRIGR
jgi:hypothetical protein